MNLLDLIYPSRCGLCGVFGPSAICSACLSDFKPAVPGEKSVGPLAYRVALYRYETRAAQAVRRLKYSRITSLAKPLSQLMREGYDDRGLDVDAIVPIPIHWSRRARRGFNQAEALCLELPSKPELLKRIRATRPQVGLDREERMRNLKDAFRAAPVKGLKILLVDDVVTSGHTAECCAEALLKQGAKEVGLLTLTGEA